MRETYSVVDDQGDDVETLTVGFHSADGQRTQTALLSRWRRAEGQEWLRIQAGIGTIDELPLRPLLLEIGQEVGGGLGDPSREFVVFRHTVPLAGFELDELHEPLMMVIAVADELQAKYVAGDTF